MNQQLSTQQKIALALSAGPDNIVKNATVVEPDGHGGEKILRKGTNDFTCMPEDPSGVGMPAMCMDKVAVQWNKDFEQHKPKPTTTVPGIEYILAGATLAILFQRSPMSESRLLLSALLASIYWLCIFAAPIFPGTAFSDPEFAAGNPSPMGVPAQLFIGFVLTAILLAAACLAVFTKI